MEVQGYRVLHPETGASMHEHLGTVSPNSLVCQMELRPGVYELRFSHWPAEWEPTAPIVVDVPAQGMIEVRVPVRRR
jgi:hypothetical protein